MWHVTNYVFRTLQMIKFLRKSTELEQNTPIRFYVFKYIIAIFSIKERGCVNDMKDEKDSKYRLELKLTKSVEADEIEKTKWRTRRNPSEG